MQNQNNNNEFRGFPLFNDVADEDLQQRNRAVTMINIVEDNYKDGKISPKGVAMVATYFSKIDAGKRAALLSTFMLQAKERGFVIAN